MSPYRYLQRLVIGSRVILCEGWLGFPIARAQAEFPLKDGDTCIMIGDFLAAMDTLNAQSLEADARIRETAQPKLHHFVVTPTHKGISI